MTRLLDADATAAHVDGLVHLDTQRAARGLDLTVGRVDRITGPGRLDFGGSEFEPADRVELRPTLADPSDDYGWWRLEAGTYAIRYNETVGLDEEEVAQIFPLPRLLRAGASHPSFVLEGPAGPVETLLLVGDGGCGLKENCLVSRLLVTETC